MSITQEKTVPNEYPTRIKCVFEYEVNGEKGAGVSERMYPVSTDEDLDGVAHIATPIVRALRSADVAVVLVLAEALIQALQPPKVDGEVSSQVVLNEKEAKLLQAALECRDQELSSVAS